VVRSSSTRHIRDLMIFSGTTRWFRPPRVAPQDRDSVGNAGSDSSRFRAHEARRLLAPQRDAATRRFNVSGLRVLCRLGPDLVGAHRHSRLAGVSAPPESKEPGLEMEVKAMLREDAVQHSEAFFSLSGSDRL